MILLKMVLTTEETDEIKWIARQNKLNRIGNPREKYYDANRYQGFVSKSKTGLSHDLTSPKVYSNKLRRLNVIKLIGIAKLPLPKFRKSESAKIYQEHNERKYKQKCNKSLRRHSLLSKDKHFPFRLIILSMIFVE